MITRAVLLALVLGGCVVAEPAPYYAAPPPVFAPPPPIVVQPYGYGYFGYRSGWRQSPYRYGYPGRGYGYGRGYGHGRGHGHYGRGWR